MKKELLMGKLRTYVSTSALLSKCSTWDNLPLVMVVTFGSEHQINQSAPAANSSVGNGLTLGYFNGSRCLFPDLKKQIRS